MSLMQSQVRWGKTKQPTINFSAIQSRDGAYRHQIRRIVSNSNLRIATVFGESRERYSLEVGAEGPALIKEVGWVVMSTGKLIVAVK